MSKCIFCQKEATLTAEHVLPDWLCDLYPEPQFVVNELLGAEIKRWPSKIFQHKVKVVCGECNNGWMSTLESDVKPVITKLVTLNSVAIDEKTQKLLSFWTQKTLLMLNQATPGLLKITQDLYDDIYINEGASKKVLVNLGWRMRYAGTKEEPIASFQINQVLAVDVLRNLEEVIKEEVNKGCFVWKAVFALGPLVFELIGHNMRVRLEIGSNSKVLNTIQPYKNDFNWPLEWPVEAEGGLEAIKSRL